MTELARLFGISRKTGYKWVGRYDEAGKLGLADRSRARETQDHATPRNVVDVLLAARDDYPTWGAKKLIPLLVRLHPSLEFPCVSTATDILKREGRITPRTRSPRAKRLPSNIRPVCGPNSTWCMDHKGQFRLGNGVLCFPFTLTDASSRKLLRCDAGTGVETAPVQRSLDRAFREFGLPSFARSDNGVPFGVPNGGIGISSLAVWLLELGVIPEYINAGHPQENGSHERMHRTLKEETTAPPAHSLPKQQRRFDAFLKEFNSIRPHEALGQETPDSHYCASLRKMPDSIAPAEYARHVEVRTVDVKGYIKWRGEAHFLATALAGRNLGIEPIADGLSRVQFLNVQVGMIDEPEDLFIPNPDWHLPQQLL